MAENRDAADLNLVLAVIKAEDALKTRAMEHIRDRPRLVMPFSVGIELLVIARRDGIDPAIAIGACQAWFDVEESDVLLTAAQMLVDGDTSTPFDAVHLAGVFLREAKLHTADEKLLKPALPTVRF